jgi:hypothetical protein
LLCSAALWSAGCNRGRSDTPPPPAPAPIARSGAEALSQPQTSVTLPAPQAIPDGAIPPQAAPELAGPPSPEPRAAPPLEAPRPDPAETPAPAAASQATTPPRPIPQLEPILSGQQRQAYNQDIDRSLGRVRELLDTLGRRQLAGGSRSELGRIEELSRQAQQARGQDLEKARNLAGQARLLAEDLERTTRRR